MRIAAVTLSSLILAACSGGAKADAESPIQAPQGAPEIVQETFKICAVVVNEGDALNAEQIAVELGWANELGMGQTIGPLDIMRSMTLVKTDSSDVLQISEHDGVHSKYSHCQLIWRDRDSKEPSLPQLLDDMPNFDGRWISMDDEAAGRWSKRTGNSILNIQATQTWSSFTTIFISKVTLK